MTPPTPIREDAQSYLDICDSSNFANRPGRLYPDYAARMWESFRCAKVIVTGPEPAAARAPVGSFAKTEAFVTSLVPTVTCLASAA